MMRANGLPWKAGPAGGLPIPPRSALTVSDRRGARVSEPSGLRNELAGLGQPVGPGNTETGEEVVDIRSV